jgi:hypothetical protein
MFNKEKAEEVHPHNFEKEWDLYESQAKAILPFYHKTV